MNVRLYKVCAGQLYVKTLKVLSFAFVQIAMKSLIQCLENAYERRVLVRVLHGHVYSKHRLLSYLIVSKRHPTLINGIHNSFFHFSTTCLSKPFWSFPCGLCTNLRLKGMLLQPRGPQCVWQCALQKCQPGWMLLHCWQRLGSGLPDSEMPQHGIR